LGRLRLRPYPALFDAVRGRIEALRARIAGHTTGRFMGVIGEPVVNVLELKLALDGEVERAQG